MRAAHASVIFGRTAISKLIQTAGYLANLAAGDTETAFKNTFTSDFSLMLKCRNEVAHGVYLGTNGDGDFCFLTGLFDDGADGYRSNL